MYLQRCSFNKPSSFNFFANSISPLIKGVLKVLPSIGISSGVESFFRFFEIAAAFALAKALLKKYQVTPIYLFFLADVI